jgi:2-dehydro-3-deoxygluconokinase
VDPNVTGDRVVDVGEQLARRVAAESKGVRHVALTFRETVSSSHNRWGALLYDVEQDRAVLAPLDKNNAYAPYEIAHIVDRVGAGDSFSGGLIRGMLLKKSLEETLAFAVAASCLKHSVPGDLNLVSEAEVNDLLEGGSVGMIAR